MDLFNKFIGFWFLIAFLKSAEFSPDQIIEFWQPKRESVYFQIVEKFDSQAKLLFDLRKQRIIDDFYAVRQQPVFLQTAQSIIVNNESDDENPFDCIALSTSKNVVCNNVSMLQRLSSLIHSIFFSNTKNF